MKVCYFGTYESDDSRNILLTKALESAGVDVVHCHMSYFKFKRAGMPKSMLAVINCFNTAKLFYKYFFKVRQHDIVILGSPGERDILLAKSFAFFRRKKVVLDAYSGVNSKKAAGADFLIADSENSAKRISRNLNVAISRIMVVPMTSDFVSMAKPPKHAGFIVNIFGYPDKQAVSLLRNRLGTGIILRFISKKPKQQPEIKNSKSMAARVFKAARKIMPVKVKQNDSPLFLGIKGIEEISVLPEDLKQAIADSDVSVIFAKNEMPEEAYHSLAMKKPLIIIDPLDCFSGYTLHCNNVGQAVGYIRKLNENSAFASSISKKAGHFFKENYSIGKVGKKMASQLSGIIKN